MERTLKIVALPLDVAWADRDENLIAAETMMRHMGRGCDVFVLPELFTTGFVSDISVLTGMADSGTCHPVLDAVRHMAAAVNAAVCGSWAWRGDDGAFYNRCFFVEPDGEITCYDKQHLFALSAERRIYTPGTRPVPVVRFRGWNIAMAICYDVRFPECLRNFPARYDLLLVPANWPDARRYAWEHLLIARAIENQAYVVGANRSGHDDFGAYGETTHVYDYLGMDIGAVCAEGPCAGAVEAVLSLDALRDARKGFPVLVP